MQNDNAFLNPTIFATTYLNFVPFSYQRDFLKNCVDKNRIIGVWSRQIGKSTTIAIYILWHTIVNDESNILIISPTQEQSNLLFQKIRMFAESHPYIKSKIVRITTEYLELNNKSFIKSLPTGAFGTTIRGHTANVIVLEESGFIKDSIVDEVIIPMGAAQKDLKIIQIGTPSGKNHFYRAAYEDKRYILHKYNYEYGIQANLISSEFIEEQRENLTSLEFNAEYNAEFIEDSDAYFPQELIQSCLEDIPESFQSNPDAEYYLGVDFARLGQDSSVFIVIEKTDLLRVVKIIETQQKTLTDAIGRIKALNGIFRFKKIILDETGLGAGPTDVLKEQLKSVIVPITFTLKSKQDIYSNLKIQMEKRRLKFPNHKKLIFQLSDLRYEFTSTGDMKIHHSERGHDDFTDSLSLAVSPFRIKKRIDWSIA